MTRIVGLETDTYLTSVRTNNGPYHVTQHTVLTELHATKGWRRVSHQRQTFIAHRRTSASEWRAADRTTFERMTNGVPKWSRPDFQFPNEAAREASMLRHGWYRRKLARLEATGMQL